MKNAINALKLAWSKIPPRYKNWVFWAAIIAAVGNALGVSWEMFTDWSLVGEALIKLFSNPYQLVCVIVAILGVWTNPNTPGLGDHEDHLLK